MRKASKRLEYGRAQEAFMILDRIITEIDSICAPPREKRADLLMHYRGTLYDRRAIYYGKMIFYKQELNIED
jgi:hypothetical protein